MPSVFEDEGRDVDLVVSSLKAALTALPVKTAETLAKAAYETLRTLSRDMGQDPDREVFIRKPGEPRHFPGENSWCVVWESGPYSWAVPASMVITSATQKLCEPYYSFDLCFYPGED